MCLLDVKNPIERSQAFVEGPQVGGYDQQIVPHLPVVEVAAHRLLQHAPGPLLLAQLDVALGKVVPRLKAGIYILHFSWGDKNMEIQAL